MSSVEANWGGRKCPSTENTETLVVEVCISSSLLDDAEASPESVAELIATKASEAVQEAIIKRMTHDY